MKIEYSLLALGLALVYGVIVTFLPDFPISEQTLLVLVVYVLVKLGVEVVGAPVRKGLAKVARLFARG